MPTLVHFTFPPNIFNSFGHCFSCFLPFWKVHKKKQVVGRFLLLLSANLNYFNCLSIFCENCGALFSTKCFFLTLMISNYVRIIGKLGLALLSKNFQRSLKFDIMVHICPLWKQSHMSFLKKQSCERRRKWVKFILLMNA